MDLLKEFLSLDRVIIFIAGVFLSAFAYFIKRKIEDKSKHEKLDKQKKLLDIHKQMSEQKVRIDELRILEKVLTSKEKVRQKSNIALQASSKSLIKDNEKEDLSQIELLKRALEKLAQSQVKMREAIAGIDSRVGDDKSQDLVTSQHQWESYSESQAWAAASDY